MNWIGTTHGTKDFNLQVPHYGKQLLKHGAFLVGETSSLEHKRVLCSCFQRNAYHSNSSAALNSPQQKWWCIQPNSMATLIWNCTKAIISHSPKSRSIMNCDLTVPQLLHVHTGQAAGLRTIIGITLMLSSEIHAKTHCCNDKLGPCISDVTLYNLQCYIEDDSPFPPTRTDTHRSFGDAKCLCFSNKIWRKHVHCLASCTRDHRVQLRESKPAIMTF